MEKTVLDTGERLFVNRHGRNDLVGNYWAHVARYLLAVQHISKYGRPIKVLDAASGTGYGSFMLSRGGNECLGID